MTHRRYKSAMFGTEEAVEAVYGEGRSEHLASLTDIHPVRIDSQNLESQIDAIRDVEVIFGTWGFPGALGDHLDRLPNLMAVFYGASSVQHFARPLLERGITLCSAWHANAEFVARMTLGLVLLGCKGYFQNTRDYAVGQSKGEAFTGPGAFATTIAILGAGATGGRVINLLRPFGFRLLAFDPFLNDAGAAALGVRKVSLDEAFTQALVVSNHMADKPQTRGVIVQRHFEAMPHSGTFINTGRSLTVEHGGLIEVLRRRPDLTALLDVLEAIPLEHHEALRRLPNVWASSHIAGAVNRERLAIGDAVIGQFNQWSHGDEPFGRVTQAMLEAMA